MTVQQTSLFAYRTEVKPTLGNRQKVVLNAFRQKENFTNAELASFLDWPINTVTPRTGELRKLDLIRIAGIRKCKVTGRNAHFMEIM